MVLALAAGPAKGLPVSVDSDQDGTVDALEEALGSDAGVGVSTPESHAVLQTCLDLEDNDLDGLTDRDDPGCDVPEASTATFPAAGDDVFEATLELRGYPLETPFGLCSFSVVARGAAVVRRGEPVAGKIDTEIVALQVDGTAEIHGNTPSCQLPPSSFDVTIFEDPAQASTGEVTDDNADPALDFPAHSSFELYFSVAWGDQTVIPGGPDDGPAGAPLHLELRIHGLPAWLGRTASCYGKPFPGNQPIELCPVAPPGSFLCYKGRFDVPGFEKQTVNVKDDLQPNGAEYKVIRPAEFCTPVSRDGEPVGDPVGHLACFKIKGKKTSAPLLWKPKLLCEAVQSSISGLPTSLVSPLDDYDCYADRDTDRFAPFPSRPMMLIDSFGTLATEVLAPSMRCSPVVAVPFYSPLRPLECFDLQPRKVRETADILRKGIYPVGTVDTTRAIRLCVPTSWQTTALH
jgi:hypothetical protein